MDKGHFRAAVLFGPSASKGRNRDPANLRPVHGSLSRCPWCKRACNEAKGDRPALPTRQQPRQSRRW